MQGEGKERQRKNKYKDRQEENIGKVASNNETLQLAMFVAPGSAVKSSHEKKISVKMQQKQLEASQ